MTRKQLLVAGAVNASLFALNIALSPPPASAAASAWADCCRFSTESVGYCCDNCCWWDSCDSEEECPLHPE